MVNRSMQLQSGTRGAIVTRGLIAGVIAGTIFAIAEMIVAAITAGDAMMPWRMFASVVLGRDALTAATSLGVAFFAGLVAHYAISCLYGVIGSAVYHATRMGRLGRGALALAGLVYGALVWVVNFAVLAAIFFPWFLGANQPVQLVLHAVAYGLPLGLALVSLSRRGFVKTATPRSP